MRQALYIEVHTPPGRVSAIPINDVNHSEYAVNGLCYVHPIHWFSRTFSILALDALSCQVSRFREVLTSQACIAPVRSSRSL
jgi:hypothetical protein